MAKSDDRDPKRDQLLDELGRPDRPRRVLDDDRTPASRRDRKALEDVDPGTGEIRRRYSVGARKVPAAQRDLARRVLGNPRTRYQDVMGSADDPRVPEGADTAYVAYLTDQEAAEFAAASNARYVQLDGIAEPTLATIPTASTLSWLGASLAQQGQFTGSGIKVAVLDGGTTAVARAQCPWTMAVKKIFPVTVPAGTETMGTHGCLVTPEAVPPAGVLVEGMIAFDSAGRAYFSDMAAGIVWACDQGAKVVNLSFGSAPSDNTPTYQPMVDACGYARDRGVQITMAASNDNQAGIGYPARHGREFSNVHAIGAVDPATNQRASFSNYDWDLAGMLPGVNQQGLDPAGNVVNWNGTSSSAPKAALMIAMLCTGGTYTPQQAANHLRASARDLGLGRAVQGDGAWHLANAIALLAQSSQPTPGNLMQRTKIANQPIPFNTPTKVAFPQLRGTSSGDVSPNGANDTFSVVNAGVFGIAVGVRWQGAPSAPGERCLSIGNDISWVSPGGKRWQNDNRPGATTPLMQSISHLGRFAVGDKICIWAWHNATGYSQWDLEWTIGHPDNDSSTLTIVRLSA